MSERFHSTLIGLQMIDSVPFEGNGDAIDHSETLNKTLDHAMLVRKHAFTALSPRTEHTQNRVHYSPSWVS